MYFEDLLEIIVATGLLILLVGGAMLYYKVRRGKTGGASDVASKISPFNLRELEKKGLVSPEEAERVRQKMRERLQEEARQRELEKVRKPEDEELVEMARREVLEKKVAAREAQNEQPRAPEHPPEVAKLLRRSEEDLEQLHQAGFIDDDLWEKVRKAKDGS